MIVTLFQGRMSFSINYNCVIILFSKFKATKIKASIYPISVLLFLQYVLVTVIMMLLYHAGNRYDPELTHYVFDQNYLSDLGRSVSFAGIDNPSYVFYSITLCLVGVGILLFFIQLINTMNNKLRYLILFLALASTVAYIGIALNPVDVNLKIHVIYAQLAFFGFFISALFSHILLDKKKYKTATKLFWVLNIMMFCYLLLIFLGPKSTLGLWALQLKTISQKIVIYAQIFLCLGILKNIKTEK